MKGIVFREFSEMVEATFGDEMMDTLIQTTDLESRGVYTAVGTYSHTELVALVVNLAERTNIPVQDLVQAFGKYLFGRFHSLFPGFFEHDDSFSFLDSIHDVVHVEVLKLYPSAMLRISTARSSTKVGRCCSNTTRIAISQTLPSV